MFSLFRSRESSLPVPDLEQLIFEYAEHHREKDLSALLSLMRNRAVFVPADPKTIPPGLVPGDTFVTTAAHQIKIRTVTGPNGQPFVLCATGARSPTLSGGFVQMTWANALWMVLRMDQSIFGVVLQGERSWIGLGRDLIQREASETTPTPG